PLDKGKGDTGSETGTSGGTGSDVDQGVEKEKKGGLPPAVFFTGLGVTAILGGGTVWGGLDPQKNPGPGNIPNPCKDWGDFAGSKGPATECPDYKEGLAKQMRTNILIGATAVVGATTVVLAVLTKWGGEPSKPEKKEAFILPVLGVQDGVSIGAVGR